MHMLRKIIGIMKMYDSLLMCIYYIRRKQESLCYVLTYLSGHIITLHAVYCGVFVGVFLLNLFIITLKEAKYLLIR